MRKIPLTAAGLLLALVMIWSGCDSTSDGLAPYEGQRPYVLLRVTQNITPDVQWVGGLAAAVGVNRGDRAALDSTLVWIARSGGEDISSHVTVGLEGDPDFVRTVGGEPIEELADNTQYTFWIADSRALEVGLDTTQLDAHNFVDSTMTMQLVMRGRGGGGSDTGITNLRVVRRETLTGDRLLVLWEPMDVPVRQIAIRAASTGGFSNLIWHVVLPDEAADSILPPVVIGEAPEGAQEAIEFDGFSPAIHTLWMSTSSWQGSFSPSAQGYAYYQMFAANFSEDD